jgi:hypothetical protein
MLCGECSGIAPGDAAFDAGVPGHHDTQDLITCPQRH